MLPINRSQKKTYELVLGLGCYYEDVKILIN